MLLETYRAAPAITRKRLYLQAMEGVLSRSKKVLIDVDSGGNILYLPLDGLGGGQSALDRVPPVLQSESSGGQSADRSSPGRTVTRETRR
jgi:membrane protease subunit HflK